MLNWHQSRQACRNHAIVAFFAVVAAQIWRLLPNQVILPWQCLNFSPEPQGQVSLRPGLPQLATSAASNPGIAVPAGTVPNNVTG